jgi:hypothetical protein
METSANRHTGDTKTTSIQSTNPAMHVVRDRKRDIKAVHAELQTTSDYPTSLSLLDELQGKFFEQLDQSRNEKTVETKLLFTKLAYQYKMREMRFLKATQEHDIREQLSSLLKNGTENNITFDDNSLGITSARPHGAGSTSHILPDKSHGHRGRARKYPVGQQIH